MVISRAQFLAAVDPSDWATTVLRVRLQSDVSWDSFVAAVLLDDVIDLTPALMTQLEVSLRSRPRTLANLRRLST